MSPLKLTTVTCLRNNLKPDSASSQERAAGSDPSTGPPLHREAVHERHPGRAADDMHSSPYVHSIADTSVSTTAVAFSLPQSARERKPKRAVPNCKLPQLDSTTAYNQPLAWHSDTVGSFVGAVCKQHPHLVLWTSLLYVPRYLSPSSDKCTYCKSLWIKAYAKGPKNY